MAKRKRNPQDAGMRNVRASKKRDVKLSVMLRRLAQRVQRLERSKKERLAPRVNRLERNVAKLRAKV